MRVFCLGLMLLFGCVSSDPDLPPPIEPLERVLRTPLLVPETGNESPIAVVAELTGATHEMLLALLERSGRFRTDVAPAATRFRLETSVVAFRDDDATEGVIFDKAKSLGQRRRAVVELSYRVLDQAGRVFMEGVLSGESLVLGVHRLEVPAAADLKTGAYWNSPFGRATRDCLDQLVRLLSDAF